MSSGRSIGVAPTDVGGAAGVDEDVGLGGEPAVGGQAVLALHQRQPGAGTPAFGVAVEAGDVEGASVEQVQVRPAVAAGEAAGGDELVDVLEPGVVAHVERDAAVVGDVRSGAFVLEPAHRGALARYRGGVGGVDLDDPAEPERLVGFAGEVEAGVMQFPLPLRWSLVEVDAVVQGAQGGVGDRLDVGEVLVEVLLAGQHRAPGGGAAGAVVQHPPHPGPGRVLGCLQQVCSGCGAGQLHRCLGGDPAVQRVPGRHAWPISGLAGRSTTTSDPPWAASSVST